MPLKSLELSRRASEMETENAEMRLAINGMEPDAADRETKMTEYTTKLQSQLDVMKERDAALDEEDKAAQLAQATNADDSGWTPQDREFRALAQRTDVGVWVSAAAEQRNITEGPEAEYNKEVLNTWGMGDFPMEIMLRAPEIDELPPAVMRTMRREGQEVRTAITGVAAASQNNSYMDRIFAGGEGAYLGAMMPAVGPGRHTYPIVTGTSRAAIIARGTAETPAGGIATTDADPRRLQMSYEVAAVDELQMPGIGAYLASDLRMAYMSGFDNLIIDDLITALTAVDVTSGTTLTTAGLIAAVHAQADGRGARFFDDIRLLAGNGTAASQTSAASHIGALMSAATIDGVFDWFRRIRLSGNMPNPSGGEDNIIAYKASGGNPTRLIAPVWRRGNLLRDTGRLQLQGEITLTGVMYCDVILVNSDLHTQLRVETQ